MKEIKLYIGIIAVLLTTMLTACSDSLVDNDPSTTSETEEGYYKASFRIAIPSFEENATRSTVFLNEGIRNKEAMKLFCFDNKGQFVGLGKIQDLLRFLDSEEITTETIMKLTRMAITLEASPITQQKG